MDDPLARLAGEPIGHLATVRPDGRPHQVPTVFALVGRAIVSAVDWKPKSGRRLQRLSNIENDARVSFLVQHYSEDWTELWWVRVDGVAAIHAGGPEWETAIGALTEKYPQYRDRPPGGEVVWIDPVRVTHWEGTG
jgi:PPOX class probable F420-dependent enzyme